MAQRRFLGTLTLLALLGCGGSGASQADPGGGPPGMGGSDSTGTGGQGQASGGSPTQGGAGPSSGGTQSTGGASGSAGVPVAPGTALPIPARGQVLGAEALAEQLVTYDPGSLLRCDVTEDPSYQAAIDELGGVTWGYGVGVLEDQSRPRYYAGVEQQVIYPPTVGTTDNAGGGAVEIVTPDVVAVTEAAALFYSQNHGVMIVGVDGESPEFHCAAQLPGHVDQFFFHQGHLVVMTKAQNNLSSHLLHFSVEGTELRFVESIDLGNVDVLDSRRFNERLVFYTSFSPEAPPATGTGTSGDAAGGVALPPVGIAPAPKQHRALRVYTLGDALEEELYDTLLDTTEDEARLFEQITPDTAVGTQVGEARNFGYSMWASDHYFVVTEQISKTFVSEWRTDIYNVCTASHVVESPYQHCWTEYETRPNPDYVPPDNSGGDRACNGLTLSDCLVEVARVSNETIQVPVGRQCEQRIHYRWFCDAYEQRSSTYPLTRQEVSTRLFIYEYTEAGFVQVDSSVHEVDGSALTGVAPDAPVDVVTTSTETFDLAVAGSIQTLYFQNGYLYVISQGVLQTYAMGGGSIVRTATLPVVNETLQASLFSSDRLYLSDFGYSGGSDHSTLRVVGLTNPAFPTQDGATHQLPGGHRSIIAADAGIFTIGSVQTFMGQTVNALKLGLFSDPYAEETAYLILGTDLAYTWLGTEESQYFNGAAQRLLLPYSGQSSDGVPVYRVGVSQVVPGSIASEGAVVLPELVERVRPLKTAAESYLTFARNSIEWLTPDQGEWSALPVLEYFEPFAIYRRSGATEYVELQRLGTRCRLYFTNAADINERMDGAYSAEFVCAGGYPQAYDRRFVFSTTSGLEFADDHSIRELSADEVTETIALIAARQYCLLSLEIVDNYWLDPDDLPPLDEFTCMSPEAYAELRTQLYAQ